MKRLISRWWAGTNAREEVGLGTRTDSPIVKGAGRLPHDGGGIPIVGVAPNLAPSQFEDRHALDREMPAGRRHAGKVASLSPGYCPFGGRRRVGNLPRRQLDLEIWDARENAGRECPELRLAVVNHPEGHVLIHTVIAKEGNDFLGVMGGPG